MGTGNNTNTKQILDLLHFPQPTRLAAAQYVHLQRSDRSRYRDVRVGRVRVSFFLVCLSWQVLNI